MCDPMSIIGIGLSVGMAAMQYSAQQDMASKQQAANEAWVSYQRRESNAENLRHEHLRQKAEAARKGSLSELTPEKQTAAQENEQSRLEKVLTPEDLANLAAGKTESVNDKLLSGQQHMAADRQGQHRQQSRQGRAGSALAHQRACRRAVLWRLAVRPDQPRQQHLQRLRSGHPSCR
jgi:hypothetical protein